MQKFHPVPSFKFTCPCCQNDLDSVGWYAPGMWMLADLRCKSCSREFYGHLPTGFGLFSSLLLDKLNGKVYDTTKTLWLSKWLECAYSERVRKSVDLTIEEIRPLQKPLFINCLDTMYGHCLLKLLNIQYHLENHSDYDLLVLIPSFMRWLVPKGVAEIWTVDLPLSRGIEWNDWLASEISRRLQSFDFAWLSPAFPHPHPRHVKIELFTETKPFSIKKWDEALIKSPKVTFIWREDRLWLKETQSQSGANIGINRFINGFRKRISEKLNSDVNRQKQQVISLAESLREQFPRIEFTVSGLGSPGGFPTWINDVRTKYFNDKVEKEMCQLYSSSHVVIGVHGSNMLLPSAHAGAVVELVPDGRYSNLIQDLIIDEQDIRQALFRYRFLPINSTPKLVANVTTSLMQNLTYALFIYKSPGNDHEIFSKNPQDIVHKYLEIRHQKLSRIKESLN